MSEPKIPAPPRGTQAAGRRLWKAVLSDYDLGEHELVLLRQAVHVCDVCEVLQELVELEGPLRDEKAHPALVELRQQRILLARLVVALRVPFGEQTDGADGRTQYRGLRGMYGIRGSA